MPKTNPWYSIKTSDRNVYHNNTKCTEGDNIQPENRRSGTGGRPLCNHCERLNDRGE